MRKTPAGLSSYRMTRRAFLTTAGASAAAAILAACGGSSTATDTPKPAAMRRARPRRRRPRRIERHDSGRSDNGRSHHRRGGAADGSSRFGGERDLPPSAGNVAAPTAVGAATTVLTPKPGGKVVNSYFTGDPPDLDPYLNVTFRAAEFGGFFYSKLLKFDNGPGIPPTSFTPVPDLAEKYELSQDGLTYTFKLRANAKWQNKAPMNGRAVTADDVVWSFNRFRTVSPQKIDLRHRQGREGDRSEDRRLHPQCALRAVRGCARRACVLDHAERSHRRGR